MVHAEGADALDAVANANERMIEFAHRLRQLPEVRRAIPGLNARRYRSGPRLEAYVEAELVSSTVVCWWIEVGWNDQWRVNSGIYVNDDAGQQVVREFPDRQAPDSTAFSAELAIAIDALVASVADTDLTRF